jgi:hypothetical protein
MFCIGKTIHGHYIGHDGRRSEDAYAFHACENVDFLRKGFSSKKDLIGEFISLLFEAFKKIEKQPKLKS